MRTINQSTRVAGLVPVARSPGFKMKRMHHRIWGPKVGRFVDTYGAGEPALHLWLESNPKVRTYCEYAPTVDEFVNGKRLRHVFSFAVQYVEDTEELIDWVRKRDLLPDDAGDPKPERWRDMDCWAQQQGFRYRFVVDGTGVLKNKTFIANWSQILPHVQSALERNNRELRQRVEGPYDRGKP